MAFQRRLVVGLMTACSLLLVYILCLHLERPLKHLQFFSQGVRSDSRDSEEPLDRQSSSSVWLTLLPPTTPFNPGPSDQQEDKYAEGAPTLKTQTPPNTEHKPEESNKSQMSQSPAPGADGTKAPTQKPQQPTQTAKPTEPDFFGDRYMSEEVPPQTHCPDGIRSQVANTDFGEQFLKNIPVLQWAQHVTPELYQRLSQHPGTHGWGGLSIELLKETLSVLNTSANWRMFDDWKSRSGKSECIRCAVVGNGGILKDSKKGKEIDGHHYVFRTNGAIIKGFEQDVGSRTTHYTFSTNTLFNSLRSYRGAGYLAPPQSEETRYVFLPDHDRDYLMVEAAAKHTLVERGKEQGRDPTKYFGEDVSADKLKMYHPDFIRYIRNRFLRSRILNGKHKNGYRPSTGAVMLLAALHTCDQVSAYGFMTPDYNKYSDHYYDKIYHKVGFFINHDMKLEMILWQHLNQAGLIRLYMHD
ncbi:LOW QUALITY PROTEIN: alpha-N-acetylgalactosaminide alpha-2,6-sialyltransferase 2 [Notolabrus celidotus]|uniref:LOW QUALITY PROTEIN: alpha-N-acetylgalactosaminide alpha-2,6-sialyltransferase 2 n=1 Tax=Notolabrus celidotus TaxID=1203425 RepID=UPI0014901575|nr:LOW QUALITY PROTEIN: alpha-N-acetylgalactosaminide alpha-2,6-sialyltransferase 2 [Notolabrus celidotus]